MHHDRAILQLRNCGTRMPLVLFGCVLLPGSVGSEPSNVRAVNNKAPIPASASKRPVRHALALALCLCSAWGCGGKTDSTAVDIPCAERACHMDSPQGVGGQEPSSMVTTAGDSESANGGGAQQPSMMNSTGDSLVESVGDCKGTIEATRAYFTESQGTGSEGPMFDDEGQLVVPELTPGPCGTCLAKCAHEPSPSCDAQDHCVNRHCDCTISGCENGVPEGDFCMCAATCMGPGQQECLKSWLDYGQCVALACAGICP